MWCKLITYDFFDKRFKYDFPRFDLFYDTITTLYGKKHIIMIWLWFLHGDNPGGNIITTIPTNMTPITIRLRLFPIRFWWHAWPCQPYIYALLLCKLKTLIMREHDINSNSLSGCQGGFALFLEVSIQQNFSWMHTTSMWGYVLKIAHKYSYLSHKK